MASIENIIEVKQNVIDKFANLKSALMMREKLLLRQLEVIDSTSKQQIQQQQSAAGVEFLGETEQELLAAIRNYGRYQLTNLNLALQDLYLKNEDYIKPTDDHETMFKDLSSEEVADGVDEQNESVVVDFSHHKSFMERNARVMNESIVKFTLKEAKELIKQAQIKREVPVPPLNLEELDDEIESSIEEVVSSLGTTSDHYANNKYSQTKKLKQITINNCNGTINLKNIASLTINCSNEENIQAQIPVTYPIAQQKDSGGDADLNEGQVLSPGGSEKHLTKTNTFEESLVSSNSNNNDSECESPTSTSHTTTPNFASNSSSNNSSRSQSKKQKTKKFSSKYEKPKLDKNLSASSSSHEYPVIETSSANDVTCEFYNRLLNEIKRSINQEQKTCTKTIASESWDQENAAESSSFSSRSQKTNSHRLVMKNFENLKIILEANSSGDEESFHPVQIEQWLAEIISETDLEPMLNRDTLEHSKLNEETQKT